MCDYLYLFAVLPGDSVYPPVPLEGFGLRFGRGGQRLGLLLGRAAHLHIPLRLPKSRIRVGYIYRGETCRNVVTCVCVWSNNVVSMWYNDGRVRAPFSF